MEATWAGMMGNWMWTSWVRFFVRHLGDFGVNVLADSKEMKTEKKGKLDEHQGLR